MITLMGKLVAGVGINDANYPVFWRENGKGKHCHIYRTWHNMLNRCYNPEKGKYKAREDGTYVVTVSDEWLTFSNFKKWYEDHHIEGYELDKDLKAPYANQYSADTCLFIPREVNVAITVTRVKRGGYMAGVDGYHSSVGDTYYARLGKTRLGTFKDEELANQVYRIAKAEALEELAKKYKGTLEIYTGLQEHILSLRSPSKVRNRYL